MFGTTCRRMIIGTRVPAATAPSMKGCSRKDRTTPRTRRETRGISAMVIAVMTLPTLPRVSAMSAMARRMGGIDISPSMIAHDHCRPPQRKKPATMPIAKPATEERKATEKPTRSDTRVPKSTRE